ncbi:MAG: hypothetical protein A2Y89_06225 [Chloroflexi bacterium RBG_13_51_18]|nr:MAG: hypothetical protein A2Y89_06225 [Chloroflexi bacterium RBG_13_51_18]
MTTQLSEDEIYQKAKKRVEEIKGFYAHLCVYLAINLLVIIIWLVTSLGAYPWFVFPVGCWGVVVILHALFVFVFNKDARWEKNAVEKEADKLRKMGQGDK